jgi:hypothetical protein
VAKQPNAYWQHLFLHTAVLPTSNANIKFLRDWGVFRNTAPDYNPLDLSHREPGSTRYVKLSNGKYARNYTDTASAAHAFAAQVNEQAYLFLREALQTGNPFTFANHSAVVHALTLWGSRNFAVDYADVSGAPEPGAGGGAKTQKSKNVGGAWSHLMKTLAVDGHRTIVELNKATASLNRIERRLRRA